VFLLARVVPYGSYVQQPTRPMAILGNRLHPRQPAPFYCEQVHAGSYGSGGNGEGDSPPGSGKVSPLVHGCEGLRDDLGHHVRLQEGEEVVSVHDAYVAELGA
jgi:hypothetical protein